MNINKNLFNIDNNNLDNLPFNMYWKSIEGILVATNARQANVAGFTCKEDIIGKTDFDLPWKAYAPILRANDIDVMQHELIKYAVEPGINRDGKLIDYLSIKAPFYNKHKCINGVMGISIELNTSEPCMLNILHDTTFSLVPNIEKFFEKTKADKRDKINLTRREQDCLRYWMNGNSAREIGLLLNLSRRTVEYYIGNIKDKLNCYKKSELFKKVIDLNLIQS